MNAEAHKSCDNSMHAGLLCNMVPQSICGSSCTGLLLAPLAAPAACAIQLAQRRLYGALRGQREAELTCLKPYATSLASSAYALVSMQACSQGRGGSSGSHSAVSCKPGTKYEDKHGAAPLGAGSNASLHKHSCSSPNTTKSQTSTRTAGSIEAAKLGV